MRSKHKIVNLNSTRADFLYGVKKTLAQSECDINVYIFIFNNIIEEVEESRGNRGNIERK